MVALGVDGEVGELGDGIGFGPEADIAVEGAVGVVVDDQFLVQKTAAVVAGEFHPELVPTIGGGFDGGGDAFQAFVVDEFKEDDVVLQRIDAEDKVIADIADPEGKPAGLVNAAGNGFDARRSGCPQ